MAKTINNLALAFVGESQARNRYTFYAKIAKKEGYEQIASIFLETAEQEKTHAKRLFEHIQELKDKNVNKISIEIDTPTTYGTSIDNLKAAIAGENHEYTNMYPEFAKIAAEEGLTKISSRLKAIAIAEKHHEERFKKLLVVLETGTIHEKEKETSWICRECGYMHTGNGAPEKCPACDHPRAYYQVKDEIY